MLHYNVRLSHCDPRHSGRQVHYVRRKGCAGEVREWLEVDRQLVEAKTSYFTKNVEESKDNPKALFRLIRNMMSNSGETILPLHTCKRNMANDFSAFFSNKILHNRSELGLSGLYLFYFIHTQWYIHILILTH